MKLTVERYEIDANYHICRDDNNKLHRIDILVDGGIRVTRKNEATIGEDLVGREISCDYIIPFIEIACEVKLMRRKTSKGVK